MHVNLQKTPNGLDIHSTDNVDSRKQQVIDTFRNFVRTQSASRVFRVPSILLLLVASATPLLAQVQITEFMASNSQTLRDDFGQYEDWIEIYNNSASPVNLLDWALTDNPDNLFKWRFPSTNLPPKTFLVVIASNRDRHTPGLPLHTNFKLGAEGEYLALVRPDGIIATEFSAPFPPQAALSVRTGRRRTSTTAPGASLLMVSALKRDRVMILPRSLRIFWRMTRPVIGD